MWISSTLVVDSSVSACSSYSVPTRNPPTSLRAGSAGGAERGGPRGPPPRPGRLGAGRVRRLLRETRPRAGELALAEPVVVHALAADDVENGLLALLAQQSLQLLGPAQHVGVEATRQAAVAGDDQDPGALW